MTVGEESTSGSAGDEAGETAVTPLRTILQNFLNQIQSYEEEAENSDKDPFEREFQQLKQYSEELKTQEDHSCTHGEKTVNRKKNRYKDILPYDFSRVKLSELDAPGSDYINANYIRGATGSSAYIASQGPLPHTVNDFWRMVVECEVQVIVMACNEHESGKHKCENYWTDDDTEKEFGQVTVSLKKFRQYCNDFAVRTMHIRYKNSGGETEERSVCQFHYTAWPDHGVPTKVKPLVEMVRLIRDCQTSETLPVLVHCSAGCGRTGTICAIDYVWGLLRFGKLGPDFSLFSLVREMRNQRIAMVQTRDQYVLVHRAVKELFQDQLKIIHSHPYANVDGYGLPLAPSPSDKEPNTHEPTYELVHFTPPEPKSSEVTPEPVVTITHTSCSEEPPPPPPCESPQPSSLTRKPSVGGRLRAYFENKGVNPPKLSRAKSDISSRFLTNFANRFSSKKLAHGSVSSGSDSSLPQPEVPNKKPPLKKKPSRLPRSKSLKVKPTEAVSESEPTTEPPTKPVTSGSKVNVVNPSLKSTFLSAQERKSSGEKSSDYETLDELLLPKPNHIGGRRRVPKTNPRFNPSPQKRGGGNSLPLWATNSGNNNNNHMVSSDSSNTPSSLPSTPTHSIDRLRSGSSGNHRRPSPLGLPEPSKDFPHPVFKGSLSSTPSESDERIDSVVSPSPMGMKLPPYRHIFGGRSNSFRQAVMKEAPAESTPAPPRGIRDYEPIWPASNNNNNSSSPVFKIMPEPTSSSKLASSNNVWSSQAAENNISMASRVHEIQSMLEELKAPLVKRSNTTIGGRGDLPPRSPRLGANALKYQRSLRTAKPVGCFQRAPSYESINVSPSEEKRLRVPCIGLSKHSPPYGSHGVCSGGTSSTSGVNGHSTYVRLEEGYRDSNKNQVHGCSIFYGDGDETPIPPPRTKRQHNNSNMPRRNSSVGAWGEEQMHDALESQRSNSLTLPPGSSLETNSLSSSSSPKSILRALNSFKSSAASVRNKLALAVNKSRGGFSPQRDATNGASSVPPDLLMPQKSSFSDRDYDTGENNGIGSNRYLGGSNNLSKSKSEYL